VQNSTNTLQRAISKLALRSPISPQDCAAFLELPHVVRTLEPASYIIREGDPPRMCAVLLSGFAYRQKVTIDVARKIIGLNITGDMLDLQNLYLEVSDHNVQTLTRADVAFIQRSDLQSLATERPALERAFFIDALVDASIFREWIVNVGRRDAKTRIAHILCEMACRLDALDLANGEGYELPMTQEQIADATGLTSVHVNRTMRVLSELGLIERTRRYVRFPDWDRLRHAADFNGRYLHLQPPV